LELEDIGCRDVEGLFVGRRKIDSVGCRLIEMDECGFDDEQPKEWFEAKNKSI